MTAKGFKKEQREPWLSPEDIEAFKKRELTVADLAKKYWERTYIIRKWLREAGVRTTGRAYKVNQLTEQDILGYRKDELTIADLMQKYSVSDTIVYRWLKDSGCVYPRGRRRPSKSQLTMHDIKEYKANRITTAQLCEKYQKNHRTMRKWLVQAGLEIHNPGACSRKARNNRVVEMLKTHPLGEVAAKFKISRQRAHQIFKESCGLNLKDVRRGFGRPKERA